MEQTTANTGVIHCVQDDDFKTKQDDGYQDRGTSIQDDLKTI
jgi:hypothetical protein